MVQGSGFSFLHTEYLFCVVRYMISMWLVQVQVQGSRFIQVQVQGSSGSGFRVYVQGSGFRVHVGSGFRVHVGSGFTIWVRRFRVQGSGFT